MKQPPNIDKYGIVSLTCGIFENPGTSVAHFPEACEQTSSDLTPRQDRMVCWQGSEVEQSGDLTIDAALGYQKTSTGWAGRPVGQEAQLEAPSLRHRPQVVSCYGNVGGAELALQQAEQEGGCRAIHGTTRLQILSKWPDFPHSCCRILTLLTDEQSLHCSCLKGPGCREFTLTRGWKSEFQYGNRRHTFCSSWCVN